MIDPRGLTVFEWTDFTNPVLAQENVPVYKLLSEDEWEDWAYHALATPSIAAFDPPDPRAFDDWQEWAIRFNEAVQLVG